MIAKINIFFGLELFKQSDKEKLEYLTKYNNGASENVKINALSGDKIIDFYLYEYLKYAHEEKKTLKEYNDFREAYTNNDNWIKLFDKFDVEKHFDKEENNVFGKDNKSAFFEALVYEIYKHYPEKMKSIISIIIEKVDSLPQKNS